MKTPTLDKMKEVQAESQAIGNFLEWLSTNGMWVGKYLKYDGLRDAQGSPVRESTEQLLARYFDIDLRAAECEKQTILDELRSTR